MNKNIIIIMLSLFSFLFMIFGMVYYLSCESACVCEDCSVKKFFLLGEVEVFTPEQNKYFLLSDWYDEEYAPKCEEVRG